MLLRRAWDNISRQEIELMAQHSWPNPIAVVPYIVKAYALAALKDGGIAGVYGKEGQNAE